MKIRYLSAYSVASTFFGVVELDIGISDELLWAFVWEDVRCIADETD